MKQRRRIAVAYSGGRDSTALLHATLAAAGEQGVEVLALHVHHGLSPHADAWAAHCAAQCRRWARARKPVTFVSHRVAERPAKGESVEAWARQARYRALREMALAHGVSVVLLAQHRRDQAETLLLQALRGAGVAGLAGMPRSAERDGIRWQRPWLDKPRAEIDAYVRRHRLKHIEDDSNADPRFARNRLRLQVWPALTAAFEHAEASLAASAAWAQQADALLEEVAALDLAAVATDDGLQLAAWLALSAARRSNALRAWIRQRHGAGAPASLIVRLLDELPDRRSASWPLFDAALRLHRGVLRYQAATSAPWPSPAPEAALGIRRAGNYALPGWGGTLRAERVGEGGVPLAWLARLELRRRSGGERFQAGLGRPPRSLKKQFQAAGVPMWDRDGPLVYSGGQLVFVPGLGLDARVIGLPGQSLVALRWLPLAGTV
ncbi:MAG TPA: tRNA lysidine(34) synthetase TilS [Burkholderiaceae bacterium]|nr:tRNA lysidine(34) synthetase TilS [Burkholderiaceae bacterium]